MINIDDDFDRPATSHMARDGGHDCNPCWRCRRRDDRENSAAATAFLTTSIVIGVTLVMGLPGWLPLLFWTLPLWVYYVLLVRRYF